MNEKNNTITALIIGILIGILVSGVAGYTVLRDSERKSSESIERIRTEYERSNNIIRNAESTINGIIESSGKVKDIAQRNLVIIRGLKQLIQTIVPDQ
jgi:hypothetical protein